MRVFLVATAVLLAMGPELRAEPLDPGQVSAETKWLAHIDFDAARAAGLVQKAYDVWLSQDPAEHRLQLAQFRLIFGFDPIEDVQSVTLCGTGFVQESGVAIIRVKMDQQRLLDVLGREPSYRTDSYGDHTLHSWTQDKGQQSEHTATGCFHGAGLQGNSVAVVGRDFDAVKAVLDVLDGKSPSLADRDSPLKQEVPPGTVFVGRAVELTKAGLPFQSPIVRKTELLALAVGEHQGEVFVQARLLASEAEVAAQVRAAVEGFRAVALLQQSDDEDIVRALQAVQVSAAEKTVTVEWRMAMGDLVKLIEKEHVKREKAKQANQAD